MLDFTNSIANEIKEIWSKYSFFGYRKITAVLNNKIEQNNQNKSQEKSQEKKNKFEESFAFDAQAWFKGDLREA